MLSAPHTECMTVFVCVRVGVSLCMFACVCLSVHVYVGVCLYASLCMSVFNALPSHAGISFCPKRT